MSHRVTSVAGASGQGQALQQIVGFHLVTGDIARLTAFYHDVLGFSVEGPPQPMSHTEVSVLGVAGEATRQMLSIGGIRVALEQFESMGRPYPPESDAASLWFQHLALVVFDIVAAHAHLRDVTVISQHGPRQLPPASGDVKAFKFRDPDGHPLELLEFPAGHLSATWQGQTTPPGQFVLGIDHSAISVGDAFASQQFYTRLGLAQESGTLNTGPAQQDLDNLPNVRVSVAPMRPPAGSPHLELLAYEVPRGAVGPTLRPNDVAATRIAWKGVTPGLLADPDGHLHQVVS